MYKEFWRLFITEYGKLRIAVLITGVAIAVSMLEALNIGLLLPLLETLQNPDTGGNHWISKGISNLFERMRIPYNLGTLLLVMGGFTAVLSGLKYYRMVLVARERENFRVWLKTKTMWNLLRTDVSYFHQHRLGTSTDTLTTQCDNASTTLALITEMVSNMSVAIAYMAAAVLIAPSLTAISFSMVLFVSLAMQVHIVRARTLGLEKAKKDEEFQVAAVESLSGIRVIKSYVFESLTRNSFSGKTSSVGDASFAVTRSQSQMITLQEVALVGLVAGIVFVGVAVLSLEIAIIISLLFILYRLMPRVMSFNSMRQQLSSTVGALVRVVTTMDEDATPKTISGTKAFNSLKRGIELKGVWFSYDGITPVLENTNFTAEAGKMTSIVGSSGSGKSTLVDLLLRFYDPVEGVVLIDGIDLKELDIEQWRRSIGLVSQDIFLFNETIANNIRLGNPNASMEQVMHAARQAYAHDFIRELPDGYETLVGDRGWNLSGGQQQRLSLARAIVKDPQILILDEATSSLDSESEELILKYIDSIRGTCTILVVAHRMSTIQDADNIIVLQDGTIIEQGDWNSLLDEAGVFANFQRLQSGG